MNSNIFVHFYTFFVDTLNRSVEPTDGFQWGPIHRPTAFNGWWIFAVEIQWDSESIEYFWSPIQRSIH